MALEDDDDATTCAPYNRAYKKPHRALKPAVWVSGTGTARGVLPYIGSEPKYPV